MLWQSVRFLSQPGPYAEKLQRQFGDAFRFRTLLGRGIAICDPALARDVFAAPYEAFEPHGVAGSLFGDRAVIATYGAVHRQQRKLLNPHFHGARIKAFYTTMQRVVRRHLDALARAAGTGEVVVVAELAQALTLDVILETVFGADPELDRTRARAVLLGIVHGFSPALLPTSKLHTRLFPPFRRFDDARRTFDRWVDDLVGARRRAPSLGDDVLGVLLGARYEDGGVMTDAEVRDQLATLLLAGHETSAIAVAWGVYWLLREPQVLARLRKEIDALGSDPPADALVRLPYLQAVASESLRIEPIVTDVLRVCRAPFALGPYSLAPGEIAAVMLIVILRDPRIFPEPERFRPERFLERTYSAAEFLPFGGGSRRCLGAAFAEAELAIALGTIASEWDLSLAESRPERAVRRNVTMGPARGVRVKVNARRARLGRSVSSSIDHGGTDPAR